MALFPSSSAYPNSCGVELYKGLEQNNLIVQKIYELFFFYDALISLGRCTSRMVETAWELLLLVWLEQNGNCLCTITHHETLFPPH